MRRLAPILLVSLLLVPPASAGPRRCGDDVGGRSVPCDCGDILVGTRTLGADDPITTRVCPSTGLLVDVPPDRSGALVLGGYELTGSGRGFGIHVVRGGATGFALVGPGVVREFDVGVLGVTGALASATEVSTVGNRSDGFSLAGDGYTVRGCEARHNGRDGFALRGSGYHAERNRALENRRYGFAVSGREAIIGAADGNEAIGNGRDGLRLRGRGHEVTRPLANGNGGSGIAGHFSGGRITQAATSGNRRHGLRAAGAGLVVSGSEATGTRDGIAVRGAGVRDGGGNRAESCRVGGGCR